MSHSLIVRVWFVRRWIFGDYFDDDNIYFVRRQAQTTSHLNYGRQRSAQFNYAESSSIRRLIVIISRVDSARRGGLLLVVSVYDVDICLCATFRLMNEDKLGIKRFLSYGTMIYAFDMHI